MRRRKLKDLFKSLNLFSKEVRFRTKANEEYKSCFGAVLTLFITSLVFIYAQNKGFKVYYRDDTTHQEAISKNVVPAEQYFTLGELDFNVGVLFHQAKLE